VDDDLLVAAINADQAERPCWVNILNPGCDGSLADIRIPAQEFMCLDWERLT
jgi:hypothetical protein